MVPIPDFVYTAPLRGQIEFESELSKERMRNDEKLTCWQHSNRIPDFEYTARFRGKYRGIQVESELFEFRMRTGQMAC